MSVHGVAHVETDDVSERPCSVTAIQMIAQIISTHNQRIAAPLFRKHRARKPLDNRHEFGETHWTKKRLCNWVAHVETDDVSEPPGSITAIQTIARIMHKHTKSHVYAQTQTIEFKGCNAMSRMQRTTKRTRKWATRLALKTDIRKYRIQDKREKCGQTHEMRKLTTTQSRKMNETNLQNKKETQ